MRKIVAVALAMLGCAALGSCGSEGPALHPVQGQVFFMDQPAKGAQVVFQLSGDTAIGTPKPSGTAGEDGTFKLNTYPHGEGAPARDYDVLVTWYPENARELENPKNKLPAKYSEVGAPVLKATVKEGDNKNWSRFGSRNRLELVRRHVMGRCEL